MTITLQIDGHDFAALNDSPISRFNEAMSLVVHCHSQDEVDRYRDRLTKDGDEKARQCGWVKDRYGVSWQLVPA